MKKKNIIWSLLAALAVSSGSTMLTGCEDADLGAIDNRVYITEAASARVGKITVESTGAKIAFSVRMAEIIDEDVVVKFDVAPEVLEEYNQVNGTKLSTLPDNLFTFSSKEITIPAGQTTSPLVNIDVKYFETGGKNYAIPIKITRVEGPVQQTDITSKYIFQLDKPLIVRTPILTGRESKSVQAGPFDDAGAPINWGVITAQWTLEGWVRMSYLNKNNQAIFNTGSADHEIYIRFGDTKRNPNPKDGDRYNYLQIKTLGGQTETGFIFERNKWYHFCLTYDGSECVIYISGKKEAAFNPPSPKGGAVRFDYLQMVSSGAQYFQAQCNMSQVRLWKVALTQTQIQNNMNYELDGNDPNMFGYWKMDEGEGQILKDSTPNGHDAKIADGVFIGWTDYLRFDGKPVQMVDPEE